MRALLPCSTAIPISAAAHGPSAAHGLTWGFEPWLVAVLAATLVSYAVGAVRLWRQSRSTAIKLHCIAFCSGWLALVAALVSPLDTLGEVLFSAHMIQHEVLMLIAAPLLVLGRPLAFFAWALPAQWRNMAARPFHARAWKKIWGGLAAPPAAWSIHAVVLWTWHAPALFELALQSDAVHIVQHGSFLASALLFWWALIRGNANPAAGLYLLTTMIHTGVLGALLTFAPSVWYSSYMDQAPLWGLSALEDQQLGGLVMWVPSGFVLMLAGLSMIWRSLEEPAHRADPLSPPAGRGPG